MKKRFICGFLACFLSLGILLEGLSAASRICISKASGEKVDAFVHSKSNIDILFIGSSQVTTDILPIELWKHYGYTSYALSAPHDGMKRNTAILKMALQYTQPKLIFLNTDQYWDESDMEAQIDGYHMFSDGFPLSLTKIRSTFELYEEWGTRMEILFPFLLYHGRWKELEAEDISGGSSTYLKGTSYLPDVREIRLPEMIPETETEIPEDSAQADIEEFIQLCRKEGIEVVLITFPFEIGEKQLRYLNSLYTLTEKYNVPYLNLANNHSMVNEWTDFRDNTHMNISGAKKMTEYLGNYISRNYDIPNRMPEEEYQAEWNADYRAYCEYKAKLLRETNDLKELLVQCRDDGLNCAVYVSGSSAGLRDTATRQLLSNLAPLAGVETAAEEEKNYFVMIDYGNGEIHESTDVRAEQFDSSLGRIHFYLDEDDKPVLHVGGEEKNLFAHKGRADICITVFDRWSGEKICTKIFGTKRVLTSETYELIEEE